MNGYEEKASAELLAWKKKFEQKPTIINRVSKKAQMKINSKIPEKIHAVLTESVKKMVETALIGSEYLPGSAVAHGLPLEEREQELERKITAYKRTAALEGAGTGAGGFMLGVADFPLLLSIKMKFLFDAAAVFGFDAKSYEERLYILHIFKLAFSSEKHRLETLKVIENWEKEKHLAAEMDWRIFQQEYRDYIDFIKMLQLVPGIGAFVGAYANYNLLGHLGETALNCYRMRFL